jgi:hypothetical protein
MAKVSLPSSKSQIKLCSVDGCNTPIVARMLCVKHYKRLRKYGDVNTVKISPRTECSIDGCDKITRAEGYCQNHWRLWKRHGDPLKKVKFTANSRREAFEHYFTRGDPSDCWEWFGMKNRQGYGVVAFRYKVRLAHRESFLFHNGFDAPQYVMHSCDNPPCVNPHHLSAGTPQQNSQDAVDRGLSARGSRQWYSRLKEDQVLLIRDRLKAGESLTAIAEGHGVSRSCISAVKHRRTWKHI